MRWRQWFGLTTLNRAERHRDIERELQTHLELEAEECADAGMRPDAARDAAARTLGNRTLITEDLRAIWGTPRLDALLLDLRYAVRTMRRTPGVTGIAVASSALGIGACSVIFAILNFAMLTPLPVAEPDRLLSISEIDRRTGVAGSELSYPDFRDLAEARSFEAVAAEDPLLTASIGGQDDPERHWGALVSANYFAVVKPGFTLGRGFDVTTDDTRGAPPVVVLSDALWKRRFGADREIVGRSIAVNNRPATVIGVTAPGFRGTDVADVLEFWIPFSMLDEVESRSGPVSQNRRRFWLRTLGRLRPGVGQREATSELDVIAATLNTTHGRDGSRGFHLERAGQIDPELRAMALRLFAVSSVVTALVLLTSCANVANLLLGRASARRREIAARMALGASRFRLVRQLLTESLLLALIGGFGGWIIAIYVTSLLGLVRTPYGWPLDLTIAPDYRVLLFTITLSIVTAVVFGLVPALRATRTDLVADLKADARGTAAIDRFTLRNGLVVAQVGICTLLLLGMGLFSRSLQAARGTDLGFTSQNLLLLAFDPGLDHRPDPQSRQLLQDILENARAVPGVESATLTSSVPLTFIVSNSNFVPAEQAQDPKAQRVRTDIYAVGPDYFTTLGIPILAGDGFRTGPEGAARPAIVNDAFARAAFPNQSPIGRRILGDGKALQIAGIVATAKSRTIGEAPRPTIYLPILSEYAARETPRGVTLVVKTRTEPLAYAASLREAIASADRSLAVFDVRTLDSHLRDALIVPRLAGLLATVAGGIGIAIALIGVYGVLSFAVARRRRELGIRLAIGARPGEMLGMILRQGAILTSIGTVLGLFAALGVARYAASLLYGVSPLDVTTFVVVPPFVMVVALLACLLPARAAARLDPVEVLRSE